MKRRLNTTDWHRVCCATPVVLISTKSPEGVDNVSPYGMCMPVSTNPPLYAIGVSPRRQTYGYIEATGEFAVNFLDADMKRACLETARGIPADQSEFDLAGLTRAEAAEIDVALVAESPVNMECRLHWMKKAGDHAVVVGEVVAIWVNEELYDESTASARRGRGGLYHIGGNFYRRGNEIE
jgi:flavin reductase (DIM6/NTAB) family NADH-FMN oxidoreductase RutF